MNMSQSYDDLLKQVESLKSENTNLRQELQDNSSHLSKLETEACSMKDVLTHLQTAMQDDLDTTHNFTQNGSIVNEMASSMLDQNFNAKDDTLSENWMAQANALYQLETSSVNSDTSREGEAGDPGGGDDPALNPAKGNNNSGSPTSESPSKKRSGDREIYTFMQDLDKERTSVLREIEMEDKRRKWYYDQLEDLQKKLDTLPVSDTYNLQADMTRRQLEYEAQRVRELMTEDLGTSEQIAQRHDARLQRIRMIEREMLHLQQRHRDQQVAEQQKRDSGTCDHLETERDGVIVVDVACNTVVTGETGDEVVGGGGGGGGNLQDEQGLQNQNLASLYHGGWPLQHNGSVSDESLQRIAQQQDTASVMSFNSCNNSTTSRHVSNHHLGTKVEMVYSLLSMLGTHDKDDMSRTLLAMSSSQDSCIAMRQSGCLPLLIQLLHGNDKDSGLLGNTRGSKAARARAAAALHNIVHSHPDDKRGRREARVLRLLEQIRAHCDQLRETGSKDDENEEKKLLLGSNAADIDHHPGPAIAALMKLSFDEEHRHAICTLGGLQAIAELLEVDHEINGATTENYNITMRRYACMALTNLTFGDGTNKALLCSMKSCMLGLVAQLQSYNEDLRQVAASVLRNLSWRADLASKKTLREVGAVTALMQAAMEVKKESTLKSILSALWNLSAHCSENKADICSVDSSLAFLVSSLTYKSPSKTLAIIENGGGILRNISSHIAVREDYRIVLRQHGCLQILLKHLRSPSLTIVSNACGTLWNLSARCPEDQKTLWEMGAVSMLRNLVHSKHKMISMGSAAALKNLLAVKPPTVNFDGSDARGKSNMPSLHVRKQKAMEAMIDQNLAETCDNVESPQGSPTETRKHISHDSSKFMHNGDNMGIYQLEQEHRRPLMRGYHGGRNASVDGSPLIEKLRSPSRSVSRSASQDSVGSVHSDISHDRSRTHNVLAKSSKLLQERQNMNIEKRRDGPMHRYDSEGQRSPEDRSGGNNRIVQVMQEVALHAGLESGYQVPNEIVNSPYLRESQSAENTPPSSRRTNAKSMPRDPRRSYQGQTGRTAEEMNSFNQRHRDQAQLANIAQRMGNLHLAEDLEPPGDDQPVNYGYKYSDTMNPPGFVKPVPKVGNYVGGMGHGPQHPQQQAGNAGSPEKSNNSQSQAFTGENIHLDMPQLPANTGYAETDLDHTDEQPTNFSIRFAEQDDDGHVADQPINYSSRFQESEAEARRARDIPEPVVDEDTMRTYYTEGTPFLSTATSMDDLTKAGAEDSAQQKRGANAQKAFSESSEGRTASTVVSRQAGGKNIRVQVANIQNNNVPQQKETSQPNSEPETSDPSSAPNSHPPSMYSYNDSSGTGSPSDRPKQYNVEGTPTCFSRASSLSSLHSSEADNESTNNNPRLKDLQSIDENSSLEITVVQHSADVTMRHELRDDSFNQSHNTSLGSNCTDGNVSGHANKSVTFDENNQVQETPLMFSRCSSLGSLSSFDAHSVHSSVVSEYSRRASEVVSPSDLPDSPSDTMPPSPTHCKSPAPATFGQTGQPVPNIGQATQLSRPAPVKAHEDDIENDMSRRTSGTGTSRVFNDAPVAFATEESPPGMSSATSLSALTIDDEPKMEKEPELRRIPLGEEHPPPARSLFQDFAQASANVTVIENANDTTNTVSLDVDNLSGVSEGEEDLLLAECISMAMPTASSKKKMKKSSSDGHIKKRSQLPKPTSGANAYTPKNSGIPTRIAQPGMRMSPKPSPLAAKMHASYHGPIDADDDYYGGSDSPRKFATEGTPLNFSRCESPLSDISFGTEPGAAKTPNKPFQQPKFSSPPRSAEKDSTEEVHSDVSSVSGDCEDLLSEAIEAAMPKNASKTNKRQQMLIDRQAEGSATKNRQRFQSPLFKQPVRPVAAAQIMSQRMPQSQIVRPQQRPTHASVSSDTVKTYAEEGTPINFSRAESPLSQMSDMDLAGNDQHQEKTFRENPNPLHDLHDDFLEDTDSPRVYGVEGTPLNFSRCESPLSQMTFNEDFEFNPDSTLIGDHITSTPGVQNLGSNIASGPGSHSNPHSISSRKPGSGLSSPGSAKTTNMRQPVQRTLQYQDIPDREDDMPMAYAVEDTPACFSRNSSLSDLNNGENPARFDDSNESAEICEAEAMGIPRDQNRSYLVEDTPAVLSGNSSLSELSVDSEIDLDTENDLLAECINAAMPKSKPKSHKKGSRSSRKSPTEANKDKDATEIRDNQPKNVKVPQPNAKIEKEATDEVSSSCRELADGADGVTSPGSDVSDGMLKQMKNASNNEKVLSSSDQTTSSTSDVIEPPAEFLSPPAEFNDSAKQRARIAASLAEGHLSMSTSSEMTDSMFERNISNEADGICGILENCETPDSDEVPIIAKEDVEATKEDVFEEEEIVEENVEEEDSLLDITQETMPEMGVSMISNSTVSTPDGENAPQNLITGAHGCVKTPVEETKFFLPDEDDTEQNAPTEEYDPEVNISLEEERALEENANLIVAEISNLSMDLSTSTLSDDLLEQETISLVSNTDYNSDSGSEASVSLSCSSKTMSDRGEISSSNTPSAASSAHSTPQKKPGRPRILKPGDESAKKPPVPDEAPSKGIRGKRKALYPGARTVSVSPKRPGVGSTVSPKSVNRTPPKAITPGQHKARNTTPTRPGVSPLVGKTPPKAPPRASSVGQSLSNKPLTTVKNRSSSAGAITSSPEKNKSNSPANTGIGQRTVTAIYRPNAGTKAKTTPQNAGKKTKAGSKVQESNNVIERPKPPIKQGTFTKDSPTQSVENLPSVTNDSEGQSSKRLSTLSSSSSRNSAELKYSNDSQEKLSGIPGSEVVKLREKRISAGSPPPRDSGSHSETETKTITKTGSNSSLNKTPTKTGLTRLGSGSRNSSGNSINKSGSSLNKTSSGSSLRSSSKSSLSSDSSLRKNSADRSSTPPRKSSTSSNASGTSIPTPSKTKSNKKPAVSRIASLWKKNDNSPKAGDKQAQKAVVKKDDKVVIKSPKSGKRSLMPFKSNKSEQSKPEKKSTTLTRSGTYDKLPTNPVEAEAMDDTEDQIFAAAAKDNIWRRTYTITNEQDDSAVVEIIADGCVDTRTKAPTTWRRHASESSADLGENQEKEGGWRRTASTQESSPTDYAGRCMVQFDGVWTQKDDGKIPAASRSGIPAPKRSAGSGIPSKLPVGRKSGTSQLPMKRTPQTTTDSNISKPVHLPVTGTGKPQVLDIKSPTGTGAPAAIVPPFNYTPSPTTQSQQQPIHGGQQQEEPKVEDSSVPKPPMDLPVKPQYIPASSTANTTAQQSQISSSPPTKHLTKTEMLIERRRRSYLNSIQKGEGSSKEEGNEKKNKSASCLVTTV